MGRAVFFVYHLREEGGGGRSCCSERQLRDVLFQEEPREFLLDGSEPRSVESTVDEAAMGIPRSNWSRRLLIRRDRAAVPHEPGKDCGFNI